MMLDGGSPFKPAEVVFRKTKMCIFHLQGTCTKGRACQFAHNTSELQRQPNLRKTRLCMAFERNGVCRDGQACKYAHGEQDLCAAATPQRGSAIPISLDSGLGMQQPPYFPRSSPPTTHGRVSGMERASMRDADSRRQGFAVENACATQDPDDALARMAGTFLLPTSCPGMSDEGMFVRQCTAPADPDNALAYLEDCSDMLDDDLFVRQCSAPAAVSTTCSSTSDDGLNDETWGSPSATDTESEAHSQNDVKPAAGNTPNAAFRKTKPCKFYARGLCARGASCNFAHEQGALEPRPDLFRTHMCFAFAKYGVCRDGDACRYAHDADQLRADLVHESRRSLQTDLVHASRQAMQTFATNGTGCGDIDIMKQGSILPMPPLAVPVAPAPAEDTPADMQPTSDCIVHAATSFQLTVKNTFLQFETAAPIRNVRSASCPCYKARAP